MSDLEESDLNAARAEIDQLHVFLEQWLRGDVPREAALFQRDFAALFDPAFRMLPPDGGAMDRDRVIAAIEGAHGASPDLRIRIRETELRGTGGDLVAAAYEEHQTGAARSATPNHARRSTALFRRAPGARHGLVWLHLHETWFTPEETAALAFDF